MRAATVALLAVSLLAPTAAGAEGEHHGARPAPRRARAAAPAPHPTVPAPPRGAPGTVVLLPRYVYDPFFYGFAPIWWGWGWGWGYYPLYPRPQYGYAPPQVTRITSRLDVFGGGTLQRGGAAAGLMAAIEGERLGGDMNLDGFYRGPGVLGPGRGTFFRSSSTYVHGSAHFTAALVATDVARLRGEIGGAFLAWPDRGPDAGLTTGGPDIGLSGQLGLVGPLGVEGYARLMPIPVPVMDALVALAFRVGPVGINAGWRELDVYKGSVNAARFSFAGPQAGLGFQF
jgi:hypothetical protein